MDEVQCHRALNAYQWIQARREAIQKRTGFQPDAVELIRSLRQGNVRREFWLLFLLRMFAPRFTRKNSMYERLKEGEG